MQLNQLLSVGHRFFVRRKNSLYRGAFNRKTDTPCSITAVINSRTPTGVISSAWHVLMVLGMCGFAEIAKSVIRFVSIKVINLIRWPLAVNIKPRKAMGVVMLTVDSDDDIPVVTITSDQVCATTTPPSSPRKYSSQRIVVKNTMKFGLRKHGCQKVVRDLGIITYASHWLEHEGGHK